MNYQIGDSVEYRGEKVTVIRYTSATTVLVADDYNQTFTVEVDSLN